MIKHPFLNRKNIFKMLYTNTNLNMNVASTETVTIKLSYCCSCFWLCWHVLHTKIISLSSLILLYIINIIIIEQCYCTVIQKHVYRITKCKKTKVNVWNISEVQTMTPNV